MKKHYIYIISTIILAACSNEDKTTPVIPESQDTVDVVQDKMGHKLIRDDLYVGIDGTLYLKSINNEDLENGTTYDVWLKTVYCDTCWTPTKDGWEDITTLNDFVDTASFHLDTTDLKEGGSIYEDRHYRYFHKWMADGGTITLLSK